MATDKQRAHALITYFQKKYKSYFATNPPGFNRHALAHGFENFFKDYPTEAQKIIDFYFDNYLEPDPRKFIYQYGSVVELMMDLERDEQERRELRKKTIERMKNVTNSSQGDQGGNS